MKRNPRRAYDAEGREIAPMPLSNMREHGVRSVEATCEDCKTLGRQGAGSESGTVKFSTS